MDDIAALIRRTSSIRDTSQKICDVQHDFTREAENLYCVLRRLQQEVTQNNSPLNRMGDTRRVELRTFSKRCLRNLDESDEFLTRCSKYHDLQTSILQTKDKIPLSDTDKKVLNKFREDFHYCAFHISQLTVKASMESIGEAKNQMDEAGYTLRYAVNKLTAQLLANNEDSITKTAAPPKGDVALWDKVFYHLREEGMSDSFLRGYRGSILAYIKAIERRTAFEPTLDPPINIGDCGTAQWEAAQEGRYRKSDHDSQSSKCYDESDELSGKPLSRKRTRSNEDTTSRQTRRDSRTNDFQSQPSTTQAQNPGFRFSDPFEVFHTFKERDGAKFAEEEMLADFLDEEPAQPPNARDLVREIYQAYDDRYDRRCEALLSRRSSQDRKRDVKEYAGLIHEVENQVLAKLDEVPAGEDAGLRGLKKKIIEKVTKVLEELDQAKVRLEG